ncbi:helix-turn-helix transcriptional regulator [Anaerovoracaceae bacterium 42-11]
MKQRIKTTRLRAERLRHDYSLKEVAGEIGVSTGTLYKYESLERTPPLQKYRKLESFFNTKENLLEIVEIEIDKDRVPFAMKSL